MPALCSDKAELILMVTGSVEGVGLGAGVGAGDGVGAGAGLAQAVKEASTSVEARQILITSANNFMSFIFTIVFSLF